jgi:hypothetical protein
MVALADVKRITARDSVRAREGHIFGVSGPGRS